MHGGPCSVQQMLAHAAGGFFQLRIEPVLFSFSFPGAPKRYCACRALEYAASGRCCETHLLVPTRLLPIGSWDAAWHRREGRYLGGGWIGSQKSNIIPAAHLPRFDLPWPSSLPMAIAGNKPHTPSQSGFQTSARDFPMSCPSLSWTHVGHLNL